MGGSQLKARLVAKFSRRNSTASSITSAQSDIRRHSQPDADETRSVSSEAGDAKPTDTPNTRQPSQHQLEEHQQNIEDHYHYHSEEQHLTNIDIRASTTRDSTSSGSTSTTTTKASNDGSSPLVGPSRDTNGELWQRPTSTASGVPGKDLRPSATVTATATATATPTANAPFPLPSIDEFHSLPSASIEEPPFPSADVPLTPPTSSSSAAFSRPPAPPRRQSLLPHRQTTLIKTLLDASPPEAHEADVASPSTLRAINPNMVSRKVWVKRPGASATLITVNEDDLVDDVRDMILKKYPNSLGRYLDAPDLTLRICPREHRQERTLGPEEPMGRTLDAYFPGGQTVDEALVIDVPTRRTPRPSPRSDPPHAAAVYFATEDGRPPEGAEGYFPPFGSMPSPNLAVPVVAPVNSHSQPPAHVPHSMVVLGTGQIPPVPSPGGGTWSRTYRDRPERPRPGKTHTASPTTNVNGPVQPIAAAAGHTPHASFHPRAPPSRAHSTASGETTMQPAAPAIPTPPAPETQQIQRAATPPPRLSSPRPASARPKKVKKMDHPVLPPGMLNGGVPPINVLIVEDNPINLKLLEAFVKRLKVRWKTAIDGRDAVNKWKNGGFHLVLMDIQLPVMNGLDATREIRRLERVNSIGVFSSASSEVETVKGELEEKDRLENVEMFKSPVIIVALTASSLQSDRHEALAAGCNDFLTKPVNFVWLERKVMEWGCMQALIDFDGWRKWKDFSQEGDDTEVKKTSAAKAKAKKNRLSMATAHA
ncbi:hypothetical protein SODALDRAFT_297737 [Sodiomyces alkalinus F11]|uniref:Response regulatory domain-containing protein n=1 Tax=Sodiomyces alkalinus (strain CBS 110278 / VKM F-3762 / F11) TaxID=1314773 RepID=A0A3N2PSP7_SODAK|nr:hypothetical protein SODALDRAFT_297737 [Sodiomyces alkalinus F11]ROT37508.1 hypothetical protein SODALDRAFT_297737 [Sodiomyces alkalinus F11]